MYAQFRLSLDAKITMLPKFIYSRQAMRVDAVLCVHELAVQIRKHLSSKCQHILTFFSFASILLIHLFL